MQTDKRPLGIGDYGVIGNCRTAVLVGSNGSIDWCCFPRFDSPSIFASILDPERGGCFSISPDGDADAAQRYLPDSNVLETRFETARGACTVVDCMPFFREDGRQESPDRIVRLVRGVRGQVALHIHYAPRPDYARTLVGLAQEQDAVVARWGDHWLSLRSPVRLEVNGATATGQVLLSEGDELAFSLEYESPEATGKPATGSPQELVERTERFWASEVETLADGASWGNLVTRSYLALRLMIFHASGGIVAAPTTSLPEEIGGVRNWDYRFTWLRDASFTTEALLALGYAGTAVRFFEWLCSVCARDWENLHIMYRIDGTPILAEEELGHLSGYRGSRPVRIGNGAADQVQHDIYGEVLNSAYLLAESGHPVHDPHWNLLQTLAENAADRWQEPDSGIWEVRGGPFHFVYSKVMCWVALDRAVQLAARTGRGDTQQTERWRQTAERIRAEVLERGWSERKQAFVQHYDSDAMDASNLLMALVGFLDPEDPRMISTVERIQEELGHGPFLSRYRTDETDDGLAGSEGAFALCTFWLIRVLAKMSRVDEARALLEDMLDRATPLGLYAEMLDPATGDMLGNFPQAFTHIGLVLAVRECGLGERG